MIVILPCRTSRASPHAFATTSFAGMNSKSLGWPAKTTFGQQNFSINREHQLSLHSGTFETSDTASPDFCIGTIPELWNRVERCRKRHRWKHGTLALCNGTASFRVTDLRRDGSTFACNCQVRLVASHYLPLGYDGPQYSTRNFTGSKYIFRICVVLGTPVLMRLRAAWSHALYVYFPIDIICVSPQQLPIRNAQLTRMSTIVLLTRYESTMSISTRMPKCKVYGTVLRTNTPL